jgi:hypothetical protein
MQELHATGGQSHSNWTLVAVDRMQIVPTWPPVTCNMNKTDSNLPAPGGHAGSICMWLAATRVQFECNWPPVACKNSMQLAATLIKFVCNRPRRRTLFRYPLAASNIKKKKICLFMLFGSGIEEYGHSAWPHHYRTILQAFCQTPIIWIKKWRCY